MKFWKTIKSNLLDKDLLPVEGSIEDELNEIPTNYKTYFSFEGCLHSYYLVQHVERFCLFRKLDWFDRIYYTVHTNIYIGGEPLTFKTDVDYAIEEQILLVSEMAYNEYYKDRQIWQ